MRIKSYFSDSVQQAMDKARIEFGPDAVLISSRQTGPDLRDLGSYEVVFGLTAASTAVAPNGSHSRSGSADVPFSGSQIVLRELAELRKEIDSFRQSVARSSMSRAGGQLSPELANIFDRLSNAGFSTELAKELTEAVALRIRPAAEKSHRMLRDDRDLFARDLLEAVLTEEIASRFEVAASIGCQGERSTAAMFVGPPGAGKTTTLMKLGLRYGLKAGQSFHLLSLDSMRLGGWEQLRTFARISGVEFRPLQDVSALAGVLSQLAGKGLTLIDTPGLAKADEEDAEELAAAARELNVDVHLVVPAHLSPAAAEHIWKRFARFKRAKLLVTHVDAVDGPATLLEFAIRSGLPVSFLANGQHVPEDIREAVKSELVEQLQPRVRTASVAA